MAKLINETMEKIKGAKATETITGKGAFSAASFNDVVNAFANDTSVSIPTYDRNTGKENGKINLSELIRNDIKETLAKAKFPQKSEIAVIDTAEIVTKGLAKAIPYIAEEYIKAGKKLDLPTDPKFGNASIYLADRPGATKTTAVRDPKTQTPMGTVDITTKDSIQVRTKSSVPAWLATKVRKDTSGKVVAK